MFRCTILLALYICILGPALSEDLTEAVAAYNKAQQGGNGIDELEAARVLGRAALADQSRSDTETLIFAATQTLALGGAETDAIELANWMDSASYPIDGPVTDADAEVLVSYVRWSVTPNRKTRKALDQALARVRGLEPSLLTLFVFQTRYAFDLESGSLKALSESALDAANHLRPIRDVVGESWSNAAIFAHSAAFNRSTNEASLFNMARHQVDLEALHAEMHQESADHPDWINQHLALTETWQMAMRAYFDSNPNESKSSQARRSQTLDDILDQSTSPAEHEISDTDYELADSNLPLCDGKFDMTPKLKYPRRALRDGRVGAVMLSIDLNDGYVSDVEILAAIPPGVFAEETIETVKQWTWQIDEGIEADSCSLDAVDIRSPFTFFIR